MPKSKGPSKIAMQNDAPNLTWLIFLNTLEKLVST